MRILVIGQRSFGSAVFTKLRDDNHDVVAHAPEGDTLRRAAESFWRHVPELSSNAIRFLQVDVIINAHGHAHISKGWRDAAKYGAIGYHPSLLPRHRGRDAVQWTTEMRDPIAGGTVYQLDDGYDTGPIIRQDWCHVDPDWTSSDLWREQLFPMGVRLLSETIDRASWGPERWPTTPGEPQDERFATYELHHPRSVKRLRETA